MRSMIRVWSRPERPCMMPLDSWPCRPSPSLPSMPRRLRSITGWPKWLGFSRAIPPMLPRRWASPTESCTKSCRSTSAAIIGTLASTWPAVFRKSCWAQTARPVLPDNQSGRLELARWMANAQHPLTARVYVNRVWRWHFGTGLVASTENFGTQGDAPSHPELLDWLARHFMEHGWSTKALHRLILNSNTYQMASLHPSETTAIGVDPENRLRWRFRPTRLDAEQIRDAILAVSERLDASLGGKTIPLRNRQFVFDHTSIDHTKYDSLRRALYLPVIRNNLYTLFQQFDFPDPTMPTGNRNTTVVAPQALLMMNSDLVMDSADALALLLINQPGDDAAKVQSAYQRVLGRPATDAETQRGFAFIAEFESEAPAVAEVVAAGNPENPQVLPRQSATRQAWSMFCQSLFASNEFFYVR